MRQYTIHTETDPDGRDIAIVGDDRSRIRDAFEEFTDRTPVPETAVVNTDGGHLRKEEAEGTNEPAIDRSELDTALGDASVHRAVLAFQEGNRDRFFRTLRACRDHDVEAVAPADQAQKVLVAETRDEWVVADLEPVSLRQRRLKRLFDIVFAMIGLTALVPVILVSAAAIKLDSRGPVLYRQQRSGLFGQPFMCCKFRTMYTESENAVPEDDGENDMITPVGRILRKTHMDEIPQLWPILCGEMSTVGPRAAWIEEEKVLEEEVESWQKRWFVKPGLTGLAQINGVSSTDARSKLEHDLEYIDRQSLPLDAWIVVVQIATVLLELLELIGRKLQS